MLLLLRRTLRCYEMVQTIYRLTQTFDNRLETIGDDL